MSMKHAHRMTTLVDNYIGAVDGGKMAGYKIVPISPDNLEAYYILLIPMTGIYKGQKHILELRTTYGNGEVYQFPLQPPKVQFLTSVYHVNINKSGGICVDILNSSAWSTINSFHSVVQSIVLLFETPNTGSPYNAEAAKLWSECNSMYKILPTAVRKTMSCNDVDDAYERCFSSYIAKTREVARSSELERFARWFPELGARPNPDHEQLLAENLEMYRIMYQKNKNKAKKSDEAKKNEDAKKSDSTGKLETSSKSESITTSESAAESTATSDAAKKDDAPEPKKPPRWARRQK